MWLLIYGENKENNQIVNSIQRLRACVIYGAVRIPVIVYLPVSDNFKWTMDILSHICIFAQYNRHISIINATVLLHFLIITMKSPECLVTLLIIKYLSHDNNKKASNPRIPFP